MSLDIRTVSRRNYISQQTVARNYLPSKLIERLQQPKVLHLVLCGFYSKVIASCEDQYAVDKGRRSPHTSAEVYIVLSRFAFVTKLENLSYLSWRLERGLMTATRNTHSLGYSAHDFLELYVERESTLSVRKIRRASDTTCCKRPFVVDIKGRAPLDQLLAKA